MEKKSVLVTGIGGNVGQGIIRNILHSRYVSELRIIGTNTLEWSAGNHLVDAFYKVPIAYDENYIDAIKTIIEKENIDLIIPSTDYETYYLSLASNELNCQVACSEKDATYIYLDKYLSWNEHKRLDIPFAESCLPSEYKGQYEKAMAKPRKGRGSRGLIPDVKDTNGLDDSEYMIQKMHVGKEITSAVYTSYLDGQILGILTMERTLENGATNYCRVVDEHDGPVLEIAEKMIRNFGLKGAFNIQSIVDKENKVHPFEVNCRISGTNSIRSAFGFDDVVYTIEELLFRTKPNRPIITKGVAYRYLADVIYPDATNLKGNNSDNFIIN